MFLGHSLLSYASIINFLNTVAPPGPRDPPGVFDKPLEQYYDYIVVGSGSAGGIIATRLTEDPAVSVLLLEAGGSDLENEQTQIPLTAGNLLRSKYDWNFKTVPQKHSHKALNNRENYYPRGKMLGGSSSINGMLYMRGSRHDYDEWERQGCKGWGYSGVLPYFKKMENVTVPELKDSPYRSSGGPITIAHEKLCDLELFHQQAAAEIGYQTYDCNGGDNQTGFCQTQANIKDGQRCSTASCYLRPNMHRKNLQISLNSHVTRVLIKDKRAEGVELIKGTDNPTKHKVFARHEVILSAGSLSSPQILLLSGIGPKKQLEKLNIPVHADLPVGEYLDEHAMLFLSFSINSTLNLNSDKFSDPGTIVDYVLNKKGYLKRSSVDGNLFARIEPHSELEHPNVQAIFVDVAFEKPGIENGYVPYNDEVKEELLKRTTTSSFDVYVHILHTRSKGTIQLATNKPSDRPIIDPKCFSNDHDVEKMLQAIRLTQKMINTTAWRSIGAKYIRLDFTGYCGDVTYDTDDYWKCMIRNFAVAANHQTSTCRMGSPTDPTAVVDPTLKVIGISNLRVADASVMRNVPSGNTNGPSMMIGEKAADIIKKYRQSANNGGVTKISYYMMILVCIHILMR
ncbi:oxygen-dependent choline dehydrogenase-like [Mytilus trossulus]|uniref:oxygen-dependent choline dehydrogenase-like n=1 Tax=Mytilus trossulus TaxID=6551 RepID=UPI0030079EE0